LERFWPRFIKNKVANAVRYYGVFDPERDLRDWPHAFRAALVKEAAAIDIYRKRRRKWREQRRDIETTKRIKPRSVERGSQLYAR
jgi:hypothetical protein